MPGEEITVSRFEGADPLQLDYDNVEIVRYVFDLPFKMWRQQQSRLGY